MDIITLEHVTKSFDGQEILRDFNLSVREGEFLAVIGRSGCGKTTMLKMMNGLLTPDEGKVCVDGKNIAETDIISLWRRYFRKYPKLAQALEMRYAIYNRQMDLVDRMEEEGKIFVIRPEIKTISRTERNREKLMEFYRHGYIQMMKQYDGLIRYLEK